MNAAKEKMTVEPQHIIKAPIATQFITMFRRITRPRADKLLEWLLNETDFFVAPASTKYHGAQPGGLLDHSCKVHSRLREIAFREANGFPPPRGDFWLGDVQEEMVAVMGLLHDLCKIGCYHQTGTGYTYKDPFPLGHGEKSVFLIMRHMELSEAEAMAIRWHMGAYDDAVKGGTRSFCAAMNMTPWVWRLHQADMDATWEDERSGDL